ncbi:FKBP-type peptidyl-prolyl cis-trans isomerase [uncultured Hymenobacter sp.]|uniref:FKBP-type peptidyl-prolyl cis-trans isomerase n=1 Tax=uncultured Hymenobacter sp. TaxID=170016 RepID=UPI0035C9C50D
MICLLSTAQAVAQTTAPPVAGTFSRLPSGTEYQLFRKAAGGRYQSRPLAPAADAAYPLRAGQVLLLYLEYRTGRDSVMMASRRVQTGQPVPLLLPPQPVQASMEEALALLLPGDSAVFRFPADSVFAKSFGQPVPPFLKRTGNVLVLLASAQALKTTTEMQAQQQLLQAERQRGAKLRSAQQLKQDEAIILAYLKRKKAVARKTPGGTYYLITRPGQGKLPQKGQSVSVLYRGTVLTTGQEFDSSAKHGNTPFTFVLGQGQVIAGWDQGVAMLPKGAKAVLYIPSPLGYGERGAGTDIPPNAVLRFEIEVVDIK